MRMSGREKRLLIILRDEAFKAQDGRCHWCTKPMVESQGPATDQTNRLLCTGDHLIPRAQGGKTVRGNIVAACAGCNNSRHLHFNVPPTTITNGERIVYSTGEPKKAERWRWSAQLEEWARTNFSKEAIPS